MNRFAPALAPAGTGNNGFRLEQPGGMGTVTHYLTAIPVARVWRDIGRKAISGVKSPWLLNQQPRHRG